MARARYEYWLSDDGLMLVAAWTRDGLTDAQIAGKMGVSRSTLSDWKAKYPEIADNMRRSKDAVDVEIENALYKNAVGYFYEEEQAIKIRDVKYGETGKKISETERIKVVKVKRWHEADVPAQIFWLKNRRPDAWRDRHLLELEDNTVHLNLNVIDSTEKVK